MEWFYVYTKKEKNRKLKTLIKTIIKRQYEHNLKTMWATLKHENFSVGDVALTLFFCLGGTGLAQDTYAKSAQVTHMKITRSLWKYS